MAEDAHLDLNVLYQSDNNYAMVTGVSMISLFENNQHFNTITVYLLDDGISPENLDKIRDICLRYNRSLRIVDSTNMKKILTDLEVEPWRGTYTTYFKLLAVDELSINNNRLLQIDGDTIINGPLDGLVTMDLQDNICAATIDSVLTDYKKMIGIPQSDRYFNCGVMLIDTNNWITHSARSRILNHLRNVRSKYFVVDQDIINILFRKEILPLDPTYNYNSGLDIYGIDYTYKIYRLDETSYFNKNRLHELQRTRPIINHCMGAQTGRPWELDSIHPQNAIFDHYLELSPWSCQDKIKPNRSRIFVIQRYLYTHLPMSVYWVIHRYALKVFMYIRNRQLTTN